jgi:hypothetical protein
MSVTNRAVFGIASSHVYCQSSMVAREAFLSMMAGRVEWVELCVGWLCCLAELNIKMLFSFFSFKSVPLRPSLAANYQYEIYFFNFYCIYLKTKKDQSSHARGRCFPHTIGVSHASHASHNKISHRTLLTIN